MGINVLMIESVGVCNSTCSYCPQGAGLLPKAKNEEIFICPTVLEKALKLAKNGNQKAIYLHHRGEPLLHPNIGYVVREVRKAGFFAYLSTNLISATDKKIDELLISGINQIEMHMTAGLTKLNDGEVLKRIHTFRKRNWELRNNGCKLEANYALGPDDTEESVRERLSKNSYYDENMYIRFYKPHDWPGLMKMQDLGVDPTKCEWYKTETCAILSNGDIVICCLDQKKYSKKVNIMDINEITFDHLSNRQICKGCIQQQWDMDWLKLEALNIPDYISRRQEIDTWK